MSRSNTTKIAKSKLIGGVSFGMKFPPSEGHANGEVIEYKMSPEEIRERYGPPPASVFTYEVFLEYRKKKLTYEQMAKQLNVPTGAIEHLSRRYQKLGKQAK